MSSSGCFYKINEADVPPKLPNSLSSLRRSLSADLSPAHINSSSFMRRAQSSDHLDHVFGEAQDHQDQKEVDDPRLNIQEKKGAFEDIWSSILSTKNNESGSGSNPPYVHPLVRRSASSLSEKSLQVCTESLGSETGSDGFGSEEFHPEAVEPEPQVQVQAPRFVGNYNYNECESEANKEYTYTRRAPPSPIPTNKSMVRSASFPPPLPSLSQSHHMRSHRRDGRLVVEAVSTPSTACLRAHRRDGRLLLTLSSDPDDRYNYHYNSNHADDDVADDDCYPVHQGPLQNHHFDEHHDDDDDDDDDDEDEYVEEKVKELAIEFVMEEERASCKMIMTSKLIGSKKWEARNFNATVINEVAAEDEAAPPLLPPLNTSTTTALNAYEYYWRRSSTAAVVVKDENGNYNKWVLGRNGNKITAQAQIQTQAQAQGRRNVVMKEVVVGKEYENLIPLLRGCKAKEPRRSLLFLEPYCIATS